jgi:hypothetical protein
MDTRLAGDETRDARDEVVRAPPVAGVVGDKRPPDPHLVRRARRRLSVGRGRGLEQRTVGDRIARAVKIPPDRGGAGFIEERLGLHPAKRHRDHPHTGQKQQRKRAAVQPLPEDVEDGDGDGLEVDH